LKSLEIISLYRPAAPTGTPPEPLLLLPLLDHLLHSFESTLLLLPCGGGAESGYRRLNITTP